MLTISKPLSAGQAQNYHQKEFTAKEQNYWSQRGVIAGEWQGRLAAQFGLVGAVSAEDFGKLSQGQHPETGEQLVRQRASYEYQDADGKTVKTMEHRAGWDATFSAPKSVSLTALVGGDECVREAHRDSVCTALEQLEYYAQARIGGNHPPETTGKFVAAKFEHDTARPVDGYVAPQLHTHAVIFNLTERENGQARAIQPQSLFSSQQFATAIYQSELTYRLKELGYEIIAGRSGAPEIKGYTQEYLDASSPRSRQIREYLERTGRNGREAAEIAAHSTRDRKEIHSPGEVMAAHRKLAADFGHQADAFVRVARERQEHQEKPANTVDRVRESLTFSRDKNFEREAVVDERALIRDGLRRGMGDITYAQVRGNLNARIASGEFQTVELSERYGDQVKLFALDLTDEAAAANAVMGAIDVFGSLDVVINNAGYGNLSSVEDTPLSEFRAQIETNLFGTIIVTKAALTYFRERKAGHFIQFSSVGGRIGPPGRGPYSAAKWGVEGFSEVLSREVAPLGIKVTIVEPGGFRTDFAGSSTELSEGHPEYDSTVGATARFQRNYNGKQPGDPKKAARAIVQLTQERNPPLRLLLGSDAYNGVEKNDLARLEEARTWKQLSVSTDYETK